MRGLFIQIWSQSPGFNPPVLRVITTFFLSFSSRSFLSSFLHHGGYVIFYPIEVPRQEAYSWVVRWKIFRASQTDCGLSIPFSHRRLNTKAEHSIVCVL